MGEYLDWPTERQPVYVGDGNAIWDEESDESVGCGRQLGSYERGDHDRCSDPTIAVDLTEPTEDRGLCAGHLNSRWFGGKMVAIPAWEGVLG